jgi:hypothetical protein
MLMGVLFRSLAIVLVCATTNVSAAHDDFDVLLRRLAEVEAEQAKSRETIEALRSEVATLRTEAKVEPAQAADVGGIVEIEIAPNPGIQETVPALGGSTRSAFPELADESRFILRSHDERFEFGIDGLMATRYEYNYRDDDGTGSSNSDQGFENVGTRINFKGYVYDDFGYWVRLQGDEFASDPFVDALIGYYKINKDTTLVFGQFPSILNRENGLPLDKLLALESTPTNYAFDPFGYKGVMLGYHTPKLVFRGIINDGYRSISNSAFDEASADWAFAGQVMGMAVGDEGDWDRFNNMTSRRGEDFAWQLNGAFHVQEGSAHGGDSDVDGSDDVFLAMVESSMEGNGWNLYSSGYYRETDGPSTGFNAKDMGFVLQGGAWFTTHAEWYARFDIVMPDNDRLIENEDFRTWSTGINYYPLAHTDNIKLGAEVIYMPDAEAESIVQPNTFNSIQASPEGDQWVFRTQAHLRW